MSDAQPAPIGEVTRLAVRVTKDAGRQIRGGHPWVFDESITSVKPEGRAGDLAVIFDDRRNFMAIGLYDPASPIRIKVLHHGKPQTIDGDFWRARVEAAVDRRGRLVGSKHTTGYRVVHGENDGLPGLVVDRYADTLVTKVYSEAWFAHLDAIVEALVEVLEPAAVVLRLSRQVAKGDTGGRYDGMQLVGAPGVGRVQFLEHDVRFEADVLGGQKTGFFLDQRENRLKVRSRAAGRRVLDVFSSSGGFSVNAAAGGASQVHSVDISAEALAAARRNMALNEDRPAVKACRHETTTGDAVTVLYDLIDRQRLYDLIVVDPPSFASRQSQVDGALRAYGRLTELALQLLEPGGTLVQASCSARVTEPEFYSTILEAAARRRVGLENVVRTGHAEDHPIGFAQGAYLKAIFARVEPDL